MWDTHLLLDKGERNVYYIWHQFVAIKITLFSYCVARQLLMDSYNLLSRWLNAICYVR